MSEYLAWDFSMPSQNLGNFYLLVGNICLGLATSSDYTVSLTKIGFLKTIFLRVILAQIRE